MTHPDLFVIAPIRPDQLQEARLVIYFVAAGIWHVGEPLDEVYARYDQERQLWDMEDVQANYFDNGGAFLVMTHSSRIVGTGALRRLEDRVGEIRRLWFLPEYQGRGLGYRMMLSLLDLAREKGYRAVRLETDMTVQSRAYNFYRKLGFYLIPHYGPDPDEISLELEL